MGLPEWERTMNLNVRAAYFLVQAFARELVARQRPGAARGRLVQIGPAAHVGIARGDAGKAGF